MSQASVCLENTEQGVERQTSESFSCSLKQFAKDNHIEDQFTDKDSSASFQECSDNSSNMRYLQYNPGIQEKTTKRKRGKIDSLYDAKIYRENPQIIKVELGK